jgi:beta-mannosidase
MFACSVYDPDQKLMQSMLLEVEQNARRIRHHACIGLICGNNEIEWHFHEYVAISGRTDREHLEQVYLDLFEKEIPAVLARVCPEIAYIPSSPTSLGGFADPNGEPCGDCHDWNPDHLSFRNRFYRYVSEFGFQSLPSIKTVRTYAMGGNTNLCAPLMERHQRSGGGNELMLSQLAKFYPYAGSTEQLIYASQQYQADSVRYRVEHMRRHRGRCMGALYWQLNDIWGGTSWASIDYFGRYKALQYAAKRFFAPVLLSCQENGMMQHRGNINAQSGTYEERCSYKLCVTNDTRNEFSGLVVATVRDAQGNVLASSEQSVKVPALSALWTQEQPFDFDPYTAHLQYVLIADERVVSQGCALFVPPKHYALQAPALTVRREGNDLIVTAAAFAKGVFIEGIDGDVILSDNSFDMERGEVRLQILSGNATEFAVMSVYDLMK